MKKLVPCWGSTKDQLSVNRITLTYTFRWSFWMLVSIYIPGRILNHNEHLSLWPRRLLAKLVSNEQLSTISMKFSEPVFMNNYQSFTYCTVVFILLFGSMDHLQMSYHNLATGSSLSSLHNSSEANSSYHKIMDAYNMLHWKRPINIIESNS